MTSSIKVPANTARLADFAIDILSTAKLLNERGGLSVYTCGFGGLYSLFNASKVLVKLRDEMLKKINELFD